MNSWIHLFSKFTHEALLIEFFFICVLTACYAAFWVMRKRKLGAVKEVVPSNLVRVYLNELIGEAHLIRTQLFGLLADTGVNLPANAGMQADQLLQVLKSAQAQSGTKLASGAVAGTVNTAGLASPAAVIAADPELKSKLAQLEAKLADQAKSMETLVVEKTKMTQELEMAKSSSDGKSAGPGGNNAETDDLKKKIQILEEKLAEYSVIEDDLANLKKLQQENAQLRAAMGGKGPADGASVATLAKPPAATISTPAAPTPAPAPVAAAPTPVATAPTPAATTPPPATAQGPEPAPLAGALPPSATEDVTAALSADGNFESAVDQVESTLATQPATAAAPPPAVETASTAPEAPANVVKSEEDLLSEFEKMLDS